MIGIGVIGCGRIAARRHVPEYYKNPNVKIIGYFDYNRSNAEAMAQKFGGIVYESLEKLLENTEIQAVSVCVANSAHALVSIQAMEAGKHVLCEKPMAVTCKEAEDMLACAKKNNRFLMIAQNQRYNIGHMRAKELIEQGIIGKPLTFKTTFGHAGPERWCADENGVIPKDIWFFDKKTASMGAMADLGVHKIDLIQYLLSDKIIEVSAKMMTLDKKNSAGEFIELEDNAICFLKLKSGITGTLAVSWTYYGEEDNSTIIFGTKGIMRIYDNSEHTIHITTDRKDCIYYDLDKMMSNDNQKESGVIDRFIESIISGDWSEEADENSVNVIRTIEASFEASRLDKTIKFGGGDAV